MGKKIVLVALFFVIGMSGLWFLFFYSDWKERNRLETLSSGTYMVGFSSSESNFTQKEIEYYSDVKLELKDNGDFAFSKSVPVSWNCSTGKWKVRGVELERHIFLDYDNCLNMQISACDKSDCVIDIGIPVFIDNFPSGWKNLPFRKIK